MPKRFNKTLNEFAFDYLPHNLRRTLYRYARSKSFQRLVELQNQPRPGEFPFDLMKTIYIHIPKTGGMSIRKALFGFEFGGYHRPLRDFAILYDKKTFDDYFKFCFVRDPWDRLSSAYFFLKKGGFHDDDRKWFAENLAKFETFADFVKGWVNAANVQRSLHFRPQIRFVETKTNTVGVDFVGRFENLAEDFETIKSRLGVKTDPLANRNANPHPKTPYDRESAEIVADVYKDDIRLFGYETGFPNV